MTHEIFGVRARGSTIHRAHLLLPNVLPIPRYFAGISSRKLITSAAIAALIVFGQSGANKGE